MASANKRIKIDTECHVFNEKWTNEYFIVAVKCKPICLICREVISVLKKSNLERHYNTKHIEYEEYQGQLREDKIKELQKNLNTQQTIFTKRQKEMDSVMQASYVVNELIKKRNRPHSDGEFIKECIVATAALLAPEKLRLFESMNLSRRTVSDGIKDETHDIEISQEDSAADFEFYSLAVDEVTDITGTAQLAIFLRGITSVFKIQEDLLSLVPMHDSIRGEDVFEKVISAVHGYQLSFEKLSGLTTNGAPAMVESQKGLVALVKKEMDRLGLDPSKLIVCHCNIHQENLCAQSMRLNKVMSIAVLSINFIKSKGFNSCQFKELLKDHEAAYGDVVSYSGVRWLTRGNTLKQFYELRNEVKLFMEMNGKSVAELSNPKWLCDLAFMVDITQYFSALNVKLQGPNQLLISLLSHVKSFETKLKLWQTQLEKGNMTHFPTLQAQKPASTVEYARECAHLLQKFCDQFQDLISKELELNIFFMPLSVEVCNVHEVFQHELTEMQNNHELRDKHSSLPVLQFYRLYVGANKFPNVRRHALKIASMFGTTYCFKQACSRLVKNYVHAR
nr:general transcription factor II-I repeat domain-containing protein 2A-like [Pelodiscus sinensis]XP_025036450.1 general transcription factor II-I repeat domain-containing protein 2A-like [Pelodiscus sinensis]|eukprot:XP_006115076.1 general transcription factor II-I repeat domain-containing protein 2A-like [Pelodiscus sinensis]